LGKVVSQSELISLREKWKRNGQRVACASGSFDLLHPGHIRLLEQGRSLGDVLVVAVQSDASMRTSGTSGAAIGAGTMIKARPITPSAERAEMLAALAAVEYVVEFDEPSPRELLLRLLPDVFVQGGSSEVQESGFGSAAELETLKCKVIRVPHEPGYSTRRLIERIAELPA
jgi:rfaE bifunctional protein nucleotidyltransferase chain/domain